MLDRVGVGGGFRRRGPPLLGILLLAAACASSPQPSPSGGAEQTPNVSSAPAATPGLPAVVHTTDGDLALTFALNAAAVVPGNRVSVLFTVRNEGEGPVSYPGRCHLDNMFWIDFPSLDMGALPQGKESKGAAGELKRRVSSRLRESVTLGRAAPRPVEHGCDAAGPNAILEPGKAVESIADWDGRLANGYPAPPGGYTISGRFYYFPSGPLGDMKPVDAQLPIEVLPGDAPASPLEALDTALSDRDFITWLEDHPIETWNTYDLRYRAIERRYEFTAELADGQGLRVAIKSDGRGPITMTPYRVGVEPS